MSREIAQIKSLLADAWAELMTPKAAALRHNIRYISTLLPPRPKDALEALQDILDAPGEDEEAVGAIAAALNLVSTDILLRTMEGDEFRSSMGGKDGA